MSLDYKKQSVHKFTPGLLHTKLHVVESSFITKTPRANGNKEDSHNHKLMSFGFILYIRLLCSDVNYKVLDVKINKIKAVLGAMTHVLY